MNLFVDGFAIKQMNIKNFFMMQVLGQLAILFDNFLLYRILGREKRTCLVRMLNV
jgi:hypothetical protein